MTPTADFIKARSANRVMIRPRTVENPRGVSLRDIVRRVIAEHRDVLLALKDR